MIGHRIQRLVGAAALVALGGCVDAPRVTAPDEVRDVMAMQASPHFALQPTAAELSTLTRARAVVIDVDTDSVLASTEQSIDPAAPFWTLDLAFSFTVADPPDVILRTEVLSGDAATEAVEWSGKTSAFPVKVSVDAQVREIGLFRGPLANLDLTGLTVADAPGPLLEGGSVRLDVRLDGETTGTRVFFEALDPSVATVDANGVVRAAAPGTARVVALAGKVADSVTVVVEEVVLPEPDEISEEVAPQVDYTSVEVAGTLEDPVGATMITSTLDDLAVALVSRSGAAAVSAFEGAVDAWKSYGEGTALRILDGPQLSLIEITLIHAADALGIPFG